MLFSEEFNISKIYNIWLHTPSPKTVYKYPPKLPTYELMCCTDGEAEINFNNKIIKLTSGELLYLPKGIDNDIYTFSVGDRHTCYNIYFDTDCEMPPYAMWFSPKRTNFQTVYEKLYGIWIGKKPGYYYSAMTEAYEIFKLVYLMQCNYLSNKNIAHLDVLDEYIPKHYCDMDFDYSVLHKMCGLSYSYFKKLFISKYGVPPVKYITGLKIKRACELLLINTYSVAEIAEMCGFANTYYFSTVFKKQTGFAPSKYPLR